MLFSTLVLCALVLTASAPSQAAPQKRKRAKPGPPTWYRGELDTALKEAHERNVPLLVCCSLDGEEASNRFNGILRDSKALGVLNQNTIMILVSNGEHEKIKMKVTDASGKRVRKPVCSEFLTEDCDVHNLNWDKVYQRYVADQNEGQWALPETIVLGPDGTIQGRNSNGQPPDLSTLVRSIESLHKKVGPSIAPGDLTEVRNKIAAGKNLERGKFWIDSWQTWSRVLELAPAGPHRERAERGKLSSHEGLKSMLAEALGKRSAETLEDCYRSLKRLEFTGSPVARDARAALANLAREPTFKEAIKVIKLELEAEDLLEQAEAALDSNDPKGAKRLFRKLGGSKYETTHTSALARVKYKEYFQG